VLASAPSFTGAWPSTTTPSQQPAVGTPMQVSTTGYSAVPST
jgi:hypothetical protein